MLRRSNDAAVARSPRPRAAHVGWRPGWVSRGVALLTLALAITPQGAWACPNVNVTKTKTVKNTTGGTVGGVRFKISVSTPLWCHAVNPNIHPIGFTSTVIPNTTTQFDFLYTGSIPNNGTVTCGYVYYGGNGNIYITDWWFTDNAGVQVGSTHRQIAIRHGILLSSLEMGNAGPVPLKAKDIKFKLYDTPLPPGDLVPTPAFISSFTPVSDSVEVSPGTTQVVDLPAQPPNGGSSIAYFTVQEPGETEQAIDLIQTNFTVAVPALSLEQVMALAVLVLGTGMFAVRRRFNPESA